jgi:hypothetical protein
MSSTYEILTNAQELISDKKRWTQGAYARDANGGKVGALNPNAVCWCWTGAVIKCGGGQTFGAGLSGELLDLLKGETAGPVHTNDDKGHTAAMALFERLRAKAKAA